MPANLIGIQEQGADLSDLYVSPAEAADLEALGYLNGYGREAYGIDYGTLWAWGVNNDGQLGLNIITNISMPLQVGSLTNWKLIGAGAYHTSAIKTDGTLWAWGNNNNGQLGLGDRTHRSSPVQVGSLTNWKQVDGGNYYTVSIKTDGTLWAWGNNNNGQLGLGDRTHRSSPVQVGSLTNWQSVCTGEFHTLAIKTDGTLWAWGFNGFYGQLGLGDITHRSSPVQVGSLTNWKQISASVDESSSLAVKTDGTLWAWGNNYYGNLGLGDKTSKSSPVQVGSLTNWKQVTVGLRFSLATKTDGTLWAWGHNGDGGTLGLIDGVHRSSPTQVGLLTNWQSVYCGQFHTTAIKYDGTLWTWGYNLDGRLGLFDRSNRASPVQIGTANKWKSANSGIEHTLAIK